MIQNHDEDSILVKNVSEKELEEYETWINQTRWSGNMAYRLFPSKQQDRATLFIDSGFGRTWRNEILPALEEYWGEDRIIHEVKFEG